MLTGEARGCAGRQVEVAHLASAIRCRLRSLLHRAGDGCQWIQVQLPLEGGGEPLPKTAVPTNTLLLGSCVSHAKCARSAASALNAVLAWLGGAGAGAWCWCWCRLHACLGAAQPRGRSLLATQGLDAELPHRAHGALPLRGTLHMKFCCQFHARVNRFGPGFHCKPCTKRHNNTKCGV